MSWEVKIIDSIPRKIHRIVVHRFSVGDVEDSELYASVPLWKWQESDSGKYVMSKAIETPMWQKHFDVSRFSTQYAIIAKLYEEDYLYYKLKYE